MLAALEAEREEAEREDKEEEEGPMNTNVMQFIATDGHADLEIEANTAEEAAQKYVDGGDWGDDDSSTTWVTIYVRQAGEDEDGDEYDAETYTIAIDPEEPECIDDETHEWVEISLQGSGGGVIHVDRCAICGCTRTTDTWAQNPETGEQGLRSIEYIEGDLDSLHEEYRREYVSGKAGDVLAEGEDTGAGTGDGDGWTVSIHQAPGGWYCARLYEENGGHDECTYHWTRDLDEARDDAKSWADSLEATIEGQVVHRWDDKEVA